MAPDASANRPRRQARGGAKPSPPQTRFLAHKVEPLCPSATAIGLGCILWQNLGTVRERAEYHQPAPEAPREGGVGLPAVIVQLSRRTARSTIEVIRRAQPFGVSVIDEKEDQLVTLVCESTTFLLMDQFAGERWAVELFLNRRRAADGGHAVLVTGRSGKPDEHVVYGLIELTARHWVPSTATSSRPPAGPRPTYRTRR